MGVSKSTSNAVARSVKKTGPSPRSVSGRLAAMTERLTSVLAGVHGVAFTLQRSRSGVLKFVDVSEGSEKLLALEAEELMSSFALFLEQFDQTERPRFDELAAVAATKRSALKWEGKLRGRHRQKARWLRVQTQRPRAASGVVVWQGVMLDISRERDLEVALKRSRDQLSELSSYLEAGKEEERERIARDIHDELGSLLVAIKIESALLASKLPETSPALHDKARGIESLLDQAMGTASRVARELRPGILKEFGLAAAIECQAEDFSQRTGITCRTQCDDEGLDIEERCALAVFRIVQEALTNVAKHAHASLIAVRLYREKQRLLVEIRDNGRGISDVDLHKPRSFGLRGIRERVRSLHGEISIGPGEQGGTHVVLSLPLKPASRRGAEDEMQHRLF